MIHTITSGSAYAKIDTHGAQLLSLTDGLGTEYIWDGNPEYWHGHAPVLFPIVGMLRNNKATIGGKEYSMKRHGTVRHQDWQFVEKSENSLTLRAVADETTLEQYPFRYMVLAKFTIDDVSLKNEFTVINMDDKTMPYGFGGHPAFRVPLSDNGTEKFEDYVLEFSEKETLDTQFVNIEDGLIYPDKTERVLTDEKVIPLRHELFAIDALVFGGFRSKTISLYSKKTRMGVEVSLDGFPYLGIWSSQNNGPFVCIEPWVTTATTGNEDDSFENKRNTQFIEPGERRTHSFKITLI